MEKIKSGMLTTEQCEIALADAHMVAHLLTTSEERTLINDIFAEYGRLPTVSEEPDFWSWLRDEEAVSCAARTHIAVTEMGNEHPQGKAESAVGFLTKLRKYGVDTPIDLTKYEEPDLCFVSVSTAHLSPAQKGALEETRMFAFAPAPMNEAVCPCVGKFERESILRMLEDKKIPDYQVLSYNEFYSDHGPKAKQLATRVALAHDKVWPLKEELAHASAIEAEIIAKEIKTAEQARALAIRAAVSKGLSLPDIIRETGLSIEEIRRIAA